MEKKKKDFFHWLQSLLKPSSEKQGSEKKLTKYHYAIFIFVVGVAFMLVSNTFKDSTSSDPELAVFKEQQENEDEPAFSQKKGGMSDQIQEAEIYYENQLKEILESALGVGEVNIMVNVEATESNVYEKNSTSQTQITNETDREGGERKVEDTSNDEQLVIIRNGYTETPVIIKTKRAGISGVFVVAAGAENIQVKASIIEAVSRVLDVPSHRVSVLPKKKPKGE